jgi:hypothetical protein
MLSQGAGLENMSQARMLLCELGDSVQGRFCTNVHLKHCVAGAWGVIKLLTDRPGGIATHKLQHKLTTQGPSTPALSVHTTVDSGVMWNMA